MNDSDRAFIFPGVSDMFGLDPEGCGCSTCVWEQKSQQVGFGSLMYPMIVCPHCGNKRCPKATHHDNDCTGSNEPGQPGSRYQ